MPSIKSRDPLRNRIAKLSTGPYYDEFSHWWEAARDVLTEDGYYVMGDCPNIYVDAGRGYLNFCRDDIDANIFYTWYKMPSGRYEVICYIT